MNISEVSSNYSLRLKDFGSNKFSFVREIADIKYSSERMLERQITENVYLGIARHKYYRKRDTGNNL